MHETNYKETEQMIIVLPFLEWLKTTCWGYMENATGTSGGCNAYY